jgi:hypothetical protein
MEIGHVFTSWGALTNNSTLSFQIKKGNTPPGIFLPLDFSLDCRYFSHVLIRIEGWRVADTGRYLHTIDFILESTFERSPESLDYNFSILK